MLCIRGSADGDTGVQAVRDIMRKMNTIARIPEISETMKARRGRRGALPSPSSPFGSRFFCPTVRHMSFIARLDWAAGFICPTYVICARGSNCDPVQAQPR